MEIISQLFKLDIPSIAMGCFLIMASVIAMVDIIGKFSSVIGKPVKWVKKKNEDHELLIKTADGLEDLRKKHEYSVTQSIKHDKDIKSDLEKLTKLCLDKEIDDWRWEILDFSSALSSGREYNREIYDHILRIYKKYEKVLEENNLENGLVEESIKFVQEEYQQALKNGKFD